MSTSGKAAIADRAPQRWARRALAQARRSMDAVFALVPPGAWFDRPVPERHRLAFYRGHVEAFDWNLIRCVLDLPSRHASFDRLFAFGIDPTQGRLPNDAPSDWPSLKEIAQYALAVRREIDGALADVPPFFLHVALEHRLMHVETFTYLVHNLPDSVVPPPVAPPVSSYGPRTDDAMMAIPAGAATLGRSSRPGDEPDCDPESFGWDNEFDAHAVFVPPFRINQYKVTNRRYLAFVESGAPPPHFWRRRGTAWYWRTLGGEIPLPLDWPVYVTYREAAAYAEWSGHALPSEAQYHRAAYGTPTGEERTYPWGGSLPEAKRGNFNGRRWDPVGVASTPLGDSAFGVAQLVGNGWEWTSTPFAPFPGFRAYDCYPGYSAPFFDGEHYVLKGGSPVTSGRLLRRSFRNWFRPAYPYVYASFRCVER